MSRRRPRLDERGFTLTEVMITIILMGIVFAIATSTWFGVVESRRVDSATNQLVADLRLAHIRATNRLENWQVVLTADSSTYTIGPTGSPSTRDLDDEPDDDLVAVAASSNIVFETNGAAQVTGANPIEVRSSSDVSNNHTIEINTATSRIEIVP